MIEMQFWIVWNPNAAFIRLDNDPQTNTKFVHDTETSARKEAERLASMHPGERFFVLHALDYAIVEKPPVVWKQLNELVF